jgi:hypothetical protein
VAHANFEIKGGAVRAKMPKDSRQMFDFLKEHGATDFRLKISGHNILKFTINGKPQMVSFARTPSDFREGRNRMGTVLRLIRSAGVRAGHGNR